MNGRVTSLARGATHDFSKTRESRLRLLAGHGVEGDAHCGDRVQHRSRVAADPSQPNLRQVHLICAELLQSLATEGFEVAPGQLGENILTADLDLHALPTGARLSIGETAVIELTGLRNPCRQLDDFQPGLLSRVAYRDDAGHLVRRAGVMGIVLESGELTTGDEIRVTLPAGPHQPLERV